MTCNIYIYIYLRKSFLKGWRLLAVMASWNGHSFGVIPWGRLFVYLGFIRRDGFLIKIKWNDSCTHFVTLYTVLRIFCTLWFLNKLKQSVCSEDFKSDLVQLLPFHMPYRRWSEKCSSFLFLYHLSSSSLSFPSYKRSLGLQLAAWTHRWTVFRL